jgi:hypothetical protein
MDPDRCALCGEANRCSMASGREGTRCWCFAVKIPEEVIAQIPDEKRGVCICAQCAGSSKSAPAQEAGRERTGHPV